MLLTKVQPKSITVEGEPLTTLSFNLALAGNLLSTEHRPQHCQPLKSKI